MKKKDVNYKENKRKALPVHNKIVICGEEIKPDSQIEINLSIGELPSRTPIDIPVFINRAEEDGPVLLVMGGLHGDEINGIEIVKRIVSQKLNVPKKGTIITIPVLNIYGFIHFSRAVPDGKDVNRSFPGTKSGSLASRMAYKLMNEIIPHVTFGIDFHTGGASRSNYPQIRCDMGDETNRQLAGAFNAPLTIHSKLIPQSFRSACAKKNTNIIVFEGGESLRFDEFSIKTAIDGYKRFLSKMDMGPEFIPEQDTPSILIENKSWIRAKGAGLFTPFVYNGSQVKKQQVLGSITGPFGDYELKIKSRYDGIIIGINNNPVVNPGDALMHLGLV